MSPTLLTTLVFGMRYFRCDAMRTPVQSLPDTGTYLRVCCQSLGFSGRSVWNPSASTHMRSFRKGANLSRERTYGRTNSPFSFRGLGRLKSAPAVGVGIGPGSKAAPVLAASACCASTCSFHRSLLSSFRSATREPDAVAAMDRPRAATTHPFCLGTRRGPLIKTGHPLTYPPTRRTFCQPLLSRARKGCYLPSSWRC